MVILLLPIIAYIALQSNTVQNYLTRKIATHLSESLNTKESYGDIKRKINNAYKPRESFASREFGITKDVSLD